MDRGLDVAMVRRDEIDPLSRLVRLMLVIYLSPVILTVFAIGLVGMIAAKFTKPIARRVVEGVHRGHGPSRPTARAKKPTQVRELV